MKKLGFLLLAGLIVFKVYAASQVVPLGQLTFPTITISSGTTVSAPVTTHGMSLSGCYIPTTMTSTSISFVASGTTVGGAYGELDNVSGKISYTIVAGHFISINTSDFYGVPYFEIVSNSTEGATRNLLCTLKGI